MYIYIYTHTHKHTHTHTHTHTCTHTYTHTHTHTHSRMSHVRTLRTQRQSSTCKTSSNSWYNSLRARVLRPASFAAKNRYTQTPKTKVYVYIEKQELYICKYTASFAAKNRYIYIYIHAKNRYIYMYMQGELRGDKEVYTHTHIHTHAHAHAHAHMNERAHT